MAMSDYYLCDECGQKAVYDADWYDRAEKSEADICIVCKACREKGCRTEVIRPGDVLTRHPTPPALG